MTRGAVTSGDTQLVGDPYADATLTAVVICADSQALPFQPQLRVGVDTLDSIGGVASGDGSSYAHFVLFPPLNGTEAELLDGDEAKARLSFRSVADPSPCPTPERQPPEFALLKCGSAWIAELAIDVPFDADTVALVDISLLDGGTDYGTLGFWLLEKSALDRKLVVRFGFPPPQYDLLRIRIDEILPRDADSGFRPDINELDIWLANAPEA